MGGAVFRTVLAIHVLAGLVCVASGAGAALSRKGRPRHLGLGRLYLRAIAVVCATALVLAGLRWPRDNHLAVLGAVAFAAALVGYRARGRPGDTVHILGMGTSYVVMLTAFYVDNGRRLPLWSLLPTWAYWLVPALVGGPLILRAVRRRRAAAGWTGGGTAGQRAGGAGAGR